MVLCEKMLQNPKLGNGLGPWPGGFVLIGGSEAVKNNFPTLILKQKLFTRKINFAKNTKIASSAKLMRFLTHKLSLYWEANRKSMACVHAWCLRIRLRPW